MPLDTVSSRRMWFQYNGHLGSVTRRCARRDVTPRLVGDGDAAECRLEGLGEMEFDLRRRPLEIVACMWTRLLQKGVRHCRDTHPGNGGKNDQRLQ